MRFCTATFLMLLYLRTFSQVCLVNDTFSLFKYEIGASQIEQTRDSNFLLVHASLGNTFTNVQLGVVKVNCKGEVLNSNSFLMDTSSIQSGSYGSANIKRIENGNEFYYITALRSYPNYKYGMFLLKVNENLDSVFSATLYTDSFSLSCKTVVSVNDTGDIFIMGEAANFNGTQGANNNSDIYLARITKAGQPVWQKRIKTSSFTENIWAAEYCGNGKIIIAGYRTSASVNDRATFWVLDTAGTIIKTKQLTVSNLTGINVMKKLSDGNFIAGGSYNVNQPIKDCQTSFKHFVVKVDENLNIIWQKQYDFAPPSCNNIISSIEELPNGDLIFCGAMGELNTTDSVWQGLGLIFKTRADGSPIWYKTYDRRQDFASYNYATVYDIVALGDTGFACSGWFSASKQPIWFLKTDSLGCDNTDSCSPPIWVGLNKNKLSNNQNVASIFPNPAHSQISLSIPNKTEALSYEVFNSMGKIILINQKNILSINEININDFSIGAYFIRINFKDHSELLSFIKQ